MKMRCDQCGKLQYPNQSGYWACVDCGADGTWKIDVDQIVSVGSTDGVCTTAALLRYLDDEENVGLEFCQAFTVEKIDLSTWKPNRKVALVDLAVNNRNPEMTAGFVRRVRESGHTIVAIVDEHNAEDWLACLGSFDGLAIKPVSQDTGEIKSSGALLLRVLGSRLDDQSRELCAAADAADRMDFDTHFGGLVNRAVKSRIPDDSRRVYLARHFAANRDPDEKIAGWIAEYSAILANHDDIIARAVDLGSGIVRVSSVGMAVDMTTLMRRLYEDYEIVALEGEMYDKTIGAKVRQIAFGCKPGLKLDAVATLKAAGIDCSGFAAKANVKPELEDQALRAIRIALSKDIED